MQFLQSNKLYQQQTFCPFKYYILHDKIYLKINGGIKMHKKKSPATKFENKIS